MKAPSQWSHTCLAVEPTPVILTFASVRFVIGESGNPSQRMALVVAVTATLRTKMSRTIGVALALVLVLFL